MQLHKWCQFQMRGMSPLAVGLIFLPICLISSALSLDSSDIYSAQPIVTIADTYILPELRKKSSIHSTLSTNVNLKEHRLSFAKGHQFDGTESSEESSTSGKQRFSPLLNRNHRRISYTVSPRYFKKSSNSSINENYKKPTSESSASDETVSHSSRSIFSNSHRKVLSTESSRSAEDISSSSGHVFRNGHRRKYSTESSRSVEETSRSSRPKFGSSYRRNPSVDSSRSVERNSSSFKPRFGSSSKTIMPTESSVSVEVSTSSSRPIFNNGSSKNIGNKGRPIPNLSIGSRYKVRNGSDVNSTIVYLPRYSRTMANFNKTSVHSEFQPIIVSKTRRVLLNPSDYKIRTNSDTTHVSRADIQAHIVGASSKKREISRKISPSEHRKMLLELRKSSLPSKNHNVSLARKLPPHRFSRSTTAKTPVYKLVSESTIRFKMKNENYNTYATKSFVNIPTLKPNSKPSRILYPKHRRRGRNFDLDSESIISDPESSSRILPNRKITENPFNYSYSTGNVRDLILTSTPSSIEIDENGYRISYHEKKAKNLTIYEILKPRLKSEISSNDELKLLIKKEEDIGSASQENSEISKINIPETDNLNNTTLVTNNIEYETPPFPNSMVILPSRKDSNYNVEYVMVNRTRSAIILNNNKTDPHNLFKFGTRNINNSYVSYVESEKTIKPGTETKHEEATESQIVTLEDFLRLKQEENVNATKDTPTDQSLSTPSIDFDNADYVTELYESDRKAKMAPYKDLKLDSKMFYDYFAKRPTGNVTIRDFPYPEFRPGNMFRYSDIYNRQPIQDMVYTRPTPILRFGRPSEDLVTQESVLAPTTFNSLRTSIRVMSTFYPNRMNDVTMKFGNKIESTTQPVNGKLPEFRNEDDMLDDDEYRDAIDPGFTMEKLAYLLIGTCCGLSILCLFVVVIAIKCRRSIVEKRLKAQYRKRMYYHEKMKDLSSPWQQQMYDHFMYLHRPPGDSSCSTSATVDSCNCRCVTWSLGARNLDTSTRPLCAANRSSLYLQKRLPFGAASTLRYESMLGRKRTLPETNRLKNESPNTDSSHENDSLDLESDNNSDGPKQCTCIDYNVWSMPPTNVPRGFFTVCPNVGRFNAGNCSQHPPVELRNISRDVPPPVTGSNYLDRSEGVVYWTSNDERLI